MIELKYLLTLCLWKLCGHDIKQYEHTHKTKNKKINKWRGKSKLVMRKNRDNETKRKLNKEKHTYKSGYKRIMKMIPAMNAIQNRMALHWWYSQAQWNGNV